MAMTQARRRIAAAGDRRAGADVILFDPSDRPFNASATVRARMATAAYHGSTESRRTRSWMVSDSTINSLLGGEIAQLRLRSRDIVRKNPWAENAADSFVGNAVGNGIVPRPLTEDDELRRELLEAWEEFVETCDADGSQDFYGLQALVCRSHREGGDCFIRFRPRDSRDRLGIPLQLQLLEAEFVDPTYEEVFTTTGKIQAGIEFDALNRRIAYHMWREHPGESISLRNVTRVRVPAESVMHVFHVLRPGQVRGVPAPATSIAKLWELDKYDDAEVIRKQIAAMFAGFVHKPTDDSDPLSAGTVEGLDEDETPLARLEPGTVQELGPGEEITFSSPSDVGTSYEPFMRAQLRQVAASMDVTYEQLTGDLSGVNFSSIRAGLIEFWRRMGMYQRNVLIFQFCRPVWRRFVEAAVFSGRVSLPSDPAVLRSLTRVAWTPTPGREYVDPEKEVRAIVAKIKAGLISRSKAVAEQGFDAEALDREIEADNARADRMRLRFEGDGRFAAAPAGGASLAARPGEPGGRVLPPGEDDQGEDEQD